MVDATLFNYNNPYVCRFIFMDGVELHNLGFPFNCIYRDINL